jgi:mono/diheme cytochrome c family protein
MRTIWLVVGSVVAFTGIAYLGFHFAPPEVSTQKAESTEHSGAQVQAIVLAHDEPELPPGPGRQQFSTQCVICHSPRYITMQPHFPRKVWKAEVQKMVTAYKAPISEPDQAQIVSYLVAAFGTEDSNQ